MDDKKDQAIDEAAVQAGVTGGATTDAEADGYYGLDDEELDLSFLDEEDDEPQESAPAK